MSHGDKIDALPSGFRAVAASEGAPDAAIADDERRLYGVLFHPKSCTRRRAASCCATSPTMSAAATATGRWRRSAPRRSSASRTVKGGRVVCGLSGGVDSAVAAALLHEAIGDALTCIFVDTGLLRLSEAEQVVRLFRGITISR